MLADREEDRLDAFGGQRLEHGRRGRPRAVVEGQHDFVVAQEVVLLEMLEAEARTAGGVDLDRAGDAERIRDCRTSRRTWSRRRQERPRSRWARRSARGQAPDAGSESRSGRDQRRRRAGRGLLRRSRSEDQQRRRNCQSKRCRTTHLRPPRTHEMDQPQWSVPLKMRAIAAASQRNRAAERHATGINITLEAVSAGGSIVADDIALGHEHRQFPRHPEHQDEQRQENQQAGEIGDAFEQVGNDIRRRCRR